MGGRHAGRPGHRYHAWVSWPPRSAITPSQPFTFPPAARSSSPRRWTWICGLTPLPSATSSYYKVYGNHLIDVGDGELASGLSGAGRLAEPEDILRILSAYFSQTGATDGSQAADATNPPPGQAKPTPPATAYSPKIDLAGKTILITAGPTYEDLDPVRYLGNRSTGRMGIALATAAATRGATVHLVLGPTELSAETDNVTTHEVRSAREMHAECLSLWPAIDIAILAAAVADYRPKNTSDQKIKKSTGTLSIEFERNPDIAAELGRTKQDRQLLVGFALETEHGVHNARRKLKRKNLDFIVLNSPSDQGTGFGHTTNQIQIVTEDSLRPFQLKNKLEVANDILNEVARRLPNP